MTTNVGGCSIVELIETGKAKDYEQALQLCYGGNVSRLEIAMAIATHIAKLSRNYEMAKNIRIRTIYEAYLKGGLTVEEAVTIVSEVQKKINPKDSKSVVYALTQGFARDIFVEALIRAANYKDFLNLAQTMATCSMENGCNETRKILITYALAKLKTIEEFREIYSLIGYS